MPAAVKMRTDYSAGELRRLAAGTKNANQSRRLLSLERRSFGLKLGGVWLRWWAKEVADADNLVR